MCGCSSAAGRESSPPTDATGALATSAPSGARAEALRRYLRSWEAGWRLRVAELASGGDDVPAFGDTPDSSWSRAELYYEHAASVYRRSEHRLRGISPPVALRHANDAYVAAVERQATRFHTLANAFGGSDPIAMERALEALERSQLQFDQDGAAWERAVIAACLAGGVRIPTIVAREYISNGQRSG
jgi:hypothetical protein